MKWIGLILCVSIYISCTRDKGLYVPHKPTPVSLKIPEHFSEPVIPADNPLTAEGIQLGRRLYYDPILSSNGLSCSSCHHPSKSFSTPLFISQTGKLVSVPPHINLAWNGNYNWNGSEPKLDLLCLGDFKPEFFNTDMSKLVKDLKEHPLYPEMFRKAFNIRVQDIPHEELQLKIVYAISQFLRTMISSGSRFDKWIRHEGMLTDEEMTGYELFYTEKGDCFHCHGYPLMTSNTFNNNGLDATHTGDGLGRYLVTGDENDKGKFSAPTLRNIELTAPYMHDGRFKTLEEVVEFYNSGVHWNSPNIDPLMTKPFKQYGLKLNDYQKSCLVKFLKTLTDSAFINNPDFSKPF